MEKIRDLESRLVASQMISDGIGYATIDFFTRHLAYMRELRIFNASDLANSRENVMKRGGCLKHVQLLTQKGYLERYGRNDWRLREPVLRDPFLVNVKTIYESHSQPSPA